MATDEQLTRSAEQSQGQQQERAPEQTSPAPAARAERAALGAEVVDSTTSSRLGSLQEEVPAFSAALALLAGQYKIEPRPNGQNVEQDFIRVMTEVAKLVEAEHDIPWQVFLGQACLESGAGSGGGFNALTTQNCNPFALMEQKGEESVPRTYADLVEGVAAYIRTLTSKRYTAAFQHTDNPFLFLQEVGKAGYCDLKGGTIDYVARVRDRLKLLDIDLPSADAATVAAETSDPSVEPEAGGFIAGISTFISGITEKIGKSFESLTNHLGAWGERRAQLLAELEQENTKKSGMTSFFNSIKAAFVTLFSGNVDQEPQAINPSSEGLERIIESPQPCPIQMPEAATLTSDVNESRTLNGLTRPHKGCDLAMPNGTPLQWALDGGEVVKAPKSLVDDAGYYVAIKKDGLVYRFLHLKEPSTLNEGDIVTRGQIIGLSGNTGRSLGANGGYHLHFEVRRDTERGEVIDPALFLPERLKDAALAGREGRSNSYWDIGGQHPGGSQVA